MTYDRGSAYRFAAWASVLVLSMSCQIPSNPKRAGVPASGAPSLSHNLVLAGQAHSDGLCRPADNCSACHGADLKGGSSGQPSCFSCHADLWNRLDCGKGATAHTVNLGGKLHGPDYCHPSLSCAGCHGADLQGGPNAAPSCTSCHGTQVDRPQLRPEHPLGQLGRRLPCRPVLPTVPKLRRLPRSQPARRDERGTVLLEVSRPEEVDELRHNPAQRHRRRRSARPKQEPAGHRLRPLSWRGSARRAEQRAFLL